MNRSQRPKPHFVSFQQRTVTNYLAKEKTEPFPKTQASFRIRRAATVVIRKKIKLNRSLSQHRTGTVPKDPSLLSDTKHCNSKPTPFSKQRTVTNYLAKEKTEPFPKTQASFRIRITVAAAARTP